MTPWIGLTVHADEGSPGDLFPGHPLFYVERHYVNALYSHSLHPMLIPVIKDKVYLEQLAEKLDGLILTGGGYLSLQQGTDKSLPGLAGTGSERYEFEFALLQKMLPTGMPILGICRGAQMINEVYGGTLYNLEGRTNIEHQQEKVGVPGGQTTHRIRLATDSRLAHWIGCQQVEVNSFHRQAVSQPGKGLKAVAWSVDDGVIEALEGVDHPWLVGLQFHPEQLWHQNRNWSKLFAAFHEAAVQYRYSSR